jgi:hypothetical protein
MTWDLSVDDFLLLISPQLEQQVDRIHCRAADRRTARHDPTADHFSAS